MEGALPLLASPLLYLGIPSETRRSEFFSTKMKLVSIDHRADDNGFPSLSAVQVSRRIHCSIVGFYAISLIASKEE